MERGQNQNEYLVSGIEIRDTSDEIRISGGENGSVGRKESINDYSREGVSG